MATQKELENRLREAAGGAMFIKPYEVAQFMGQKKTQNVHKYYRDAFRPEGSKTYFIPDVAKAIFEAGAWS